MANVYVAATATWNGKALGKGKKEISAFEKSVKSLGKTFAVAFSARALFNFSKNAINAFAKDEAAAKSLATQLQNMGFGFATTEVERYIGNLEKSTGVLDDHLRPALQSLITATGSLTQSQKALSIALDVSAGTGKSVEEVSMALAKGFTGQTTALSRLGAGLKKTTLASGNMNEILDELGNKFSGQAQARLKTYAGQMDLLRGAAARASETIGKDLLDSISLLSGNDGVQGAANAMESLATQTGNAVYGFSLLIAKAKELAGLNAKEEITPFGKALGALGALGVSGLIFQQLARSGAAAKANKTQTNVGGYSGIPSIKERIAIVETNKARKEELKLLATKNGIENKNLEELKKKFDLERIGLNAALNSATDEETKLRLKAQLAILDGNEAMAAKLLAEMNAAEALKKLAEQAAAAGKSITEFAFIQVKILINRINDQIALINEMFGTPSKSTAGTTSSAPSFPAISTDFYSGQQNIVNPLAGTYYGETGRDPMPTNVTINVDATSMVDSANMTRVVQQAILEVNRNGYSTVPAGQGF